MIVKIEETAIADMPAVKGVDGEVAALVYVIKLFPVPAYVLTILARKRLTGIKPA
jgi:hypothetical protein